MHELGTVYYIIKRVERLCVENDLAHVHSVTVEIGEVSGIIPAYIVDCWNWSVISMDNYKIIEVKEKVVEYAKRRNPNIEVIFISAKTGEGVDQVADWLLRQVKDWTK